MTNIRIKNFDIGDIYPTRIMAAINLSTESFYKKSVVSPVEENEIRERIFSVVEQKAEFIDLGPQSSAPASLYNQETKISPSEEINRIKKPLEIIKELNLKQIISIDTQSALVADYALSNGADVINDISGLKFDSNLAKTIANYSAFVICMACDKNPGDIFKTDEVINSLSQSKNIAINAGINDKKILIDPGIGGWTPQRTPQDDYKLILDTQKIKNNLHLPSLLALSRKSFIGKILNLKPEERLYGSLSATAISILYGANIIRTHDIKETKEAVLIAEEFKKLLVNSSK